MKMPDFDKAFPETPSVVRQSVREAFRLAREREQRRRRTIRLSSAAAALILLLTVGILALRPRLNPAPDVLAGGTGASGEGGMPQVVYVSAGDAHYHTLPNCQSLPGLRPAAIDAALASGKTACPVCAKGKAESPTEAPHETAVPTQTVSSVTPEPTPEPSPTVEPSPTEEPLNESFLASLSSAQAPLTEADVTVYRTAKGAYCHLDPGCSGMENASAVSLSEALSSGLKTCPVCFGEWMVFAGDGAHYHLRADCGLLQDGKAESAGSVLWQDALLAGLSACPVCDPLREAPSFGTPEEDVTYYANPAGKYYHLDPACSGMKGASPVDPALAQKRGQTPCPVCIGGEERSSVNPDPTGIALVYATPAGTFYHTVPDCSGMKGAQAVCSAQAAHRGQKPCPVCIGDAWVDAFDFSELAFSLYERFGGASREALGPELTEPGSWVQSDAQGEQYVYSADWIDTSSQRSLPGGNVLQTGYSLECAYDQALNLERIQLSFTFTDDVQARQSIGAADRQIAQAVDWADADFFPTMAGMLDGGGEVSPELVACVLTLDGAEQITRCQLGYLFPDGEGELRTVLLAFEPDAQNGAMRLINLSWDGGNSF